MEKRDNSEGKKCFIITPIGNENTDIFRKAKGVIDSSVKPVLREHGFDDVKPAYEINLSGMINTQIINRIIEDDLVIVNLTGNNPNVMYELCLRHVVAKPIIHICEQGTNLPFDIKDNRTIFYENDMLGVEEFKSQLSKFMEEIRWGEEYRDNPIYNATRYRKLLKETQGTESNEILSILMDIKESIYSIQTTSSNKEYSVPLSSYEDEYLWKQIDKGIKGINKEQVLKLLDDDCKSKGHTSLRVHEIAKELQTKPQLVIDIANALGFDKRSSTSIVKPEEKRAILYFIAQY